MHGAVANFGARKAKARTAFVKFHMDVASVSPNAKYLWLVLHELQYPDGVGIGYSELSAKSGLCRRSVANKIQELINAGYLRRTVQGGTDPKTGEKTVARYVTLLPKLESGL